MATVSNITASTGGRVVDGAMEKLAAYAAELGLAVERRGRWKYDRDGTFLEMSVRFTVGGEEALESNAQKEFATWARYYGIEASDYGAVLTIQGRRFRLTKINSRRGVKYPFECEALDGGRGIRLGAEYKLQIIAARK